MWWYIRFHNELFLVKLIDILTQLVINSKSWILIKWLLEIGQLIHFLHFDYHWHLPSTLCFSQKWTNELKSNSFSILEKTQINPRLCKWRNTFLLLRIFSDKFVIKRINGWNDYEKHTGMIPIIWNEYTIRCYLSLHWTQIVIHTHS